MKLTIKFTIYILLAAFCQNTYAQCVEHGNVWLESWTSCDKLPNPNDVRGNSHWLLFEFDQPESIADSWFWNANKSGELDLGIKEVVIDYAVDDNWVELGAYTFPQANGSSNYTGFAGPDFGGIFIEKILITVINTYSNDNCASLAEVQFNIDQSACYSIIDACGVCDGAGVPEWFEDADNDGLGNADISTFACDPPTGYVANNDDECDNGSIGWAGVLSIFEDNGCTGCHSNNASGGLNLLTYDTAILGGNKCGSAILTGTRLVDVIEVDNYNGCGTPINFPSMNQRTGYAMDNNELALIQRWIDDGALEDCNCPPNAPDVDADGVCDNSDDCPGFDNNLIGTACDDGDDCTENDVFTEDCNCIGEPTTDSDADGICDLLDMAPSDPCTADGIIDGNEPTGWVHLVTADCDSDGISTDKGDLDDFDSCIVNYGTSFKAQCYCPDTYQIGGLDFFSVEGISDYQNALGVPDEVLTGEIAGNDVITLKTPYLARSEEICFQLGFSDVSGIAGISINGHFFKFHNEIDSLNYHIQEVCFPVLYEGEQIIKIGEVGDGNIKFDGAYFSHCPCAGFDLSLIGTPCDDGNPCTTGEVYDANCNCTPPMTNIALNATTAMSSEANVNMVASNLNDGIINNNNNKLAHTTPASPHEWVELDLGSVEDIATIVVWNRETCCSDRLSNAYLMLADTPFDTGTDLSLARANADFIYQIDNTENRTVLGIDINKTARYVRIQKSGNNTGGNQINVKEIQVFQSDNSITDSDNDGICDETDLCPNFDNTLLGTVCTDNPCAENTIYANCGCVPVINIAPTATPSMSSENSAAMNATNLNDGIISNDNSELAHTKGSSNRDWVELDLGSNQDITSVVIWNRTTCCSVRLTNAYLLVADTPFSQDTDLNSSLDNADFVYQIGDAETKDFVGVDVNITGRYVRIQKSGNNIGNAINIKELQVFTEDRSVQGIDIQLSVWLQGAYTPTFSEMTTQLSSARKLLPGQTPDSPLTIPTPAGQPYSIAPWNYSGTEGTNWTDADYTGNETDWVLVSFRTGTAKNTEVAMTAGVLMKDGTIELPDRCVLPPDFTDPVYIVVEHRNHIGAMTPQPIDVIGNTLAYDFRLSDSYRDATSFGQKQLPNGEWAMFAGDANQMDFPSFDVNGTDKTEWFDSNGVFDYYLSPDFNLDGDVNGQDKSLWFENNGISSRVPK